MQKSWEKEMVIGKDGTYEVEFMRVDTICGENTGIEYKAIKNSDGTFDVPIHEGFYKNIPYTCEYSSYRMMRKDMRRMRRFCPYGYVCKSGNSYLFILPIGSRIEDVCIKF